MHWLPRHNGERKRAWGHLDLTLNKTLDKSVGLPSKSSSQRRDDGKFWTSSSTVPYTSAVHDAAFQFKVLLEGLFSILRNYQTLQRCVPPRPLTTGPEKNLVLHCPHFPTYRGTEAGPQWLNAARQHSALCSRSSGLMRESIGKEVDPMG